MTRSTQSILEDFEKKLKTLNGKVLETYTNQKFKIDVKSKTVEVTPLSTGKLRSIEKETILKAYNYLCHGGVVEGVGSGEKSIRGLGFSETNPAYFWAILKNFDDIGTENKKLKYIKSINDGAKILVNIISNKVFKMGLWEKLDVKIQNMSEGILKDIEIKLSGPLETSGNKLVQILEGNGGQADIVIGVKPKDPGDIPIKVEVVFFDKKNTRYRMTEEAFINVANESETISTRHAPIINIGSIGSYVGEQVDKSTKIDGIVQRSTFGAVVRKCAKCAREVEAIEKFCPECGARL